VAVVGFDDLPRATVTHPFLAVAAQPAFERGRRRVVVLLDHLANPDPQARGVVLATELVIQRSSGGWVADLADLAELAEP
jgi:DNA-binding LacI/PurR family transcriptional regulator